MAKIKRITSVLIPKSISFYAFAARVRRQKRWMLARMSLAVFVQRNDRQPSHTPRLNARSVRSAKLRVQSGGPRELPP